METLTPTFSIGGVKHVEEYTVIVVAIPKTGGIYAEDLFISEYIEGTTGNQAIEIYNGTGRDIDLSTYCLKFYYDGGTEPLEFYFENMGTLYFGDTLVIFYTYAGKQIGLVGDIATWYADCEGGDVIELVNGDTRIDIIVTIGNPDYWGKNVSLVKKPILPVEIRPSI